MSIECPYCGAELVYEDSYGRIRNGFMEVKKGEIFKCPNRDGFPTPEEARAYDPDEKNVEEIACHSSTHYVSGSFYTDSAGNLHNGYPC